MLSGICWLAIILFLPETARQVVGNGNISCSRVHKAPLSGMRPSTMASDPEVLSHRYHLPNPLSSLRILHRPDSTMIILTIGVLYGVSCCMQASLSTLFVQIYGLDQIQAGLIYLPYGVGCVLAAFLTGRQLDRDYQATATKRGMPIERRLGNTVSGFPIEEARLRNIWYPLSVATAGTIGYGWALRYRAVSLLSHFSASGLISRIE